MTRYPECAATPEESGMNFPAPTMGNFIQKQLRESAGNPFRACVRASAGFHSRMAKKYGVDSQRGMAHYKLAEAFGKPTTRLQEFIMKNGGLGNVDPKAECKAHKDSIQFHKKQANKHGLNTPMGRAHISAMSHHVDKLKQAMQPPQGDESQFGHTGRQSPVPGIPKKSEQPSQDIRQKKPLLKLKARPAGEAGSDNYVAQRYDKSHPEGFVSPEYSGEKDQEAGVKGMKWGEHVAHAQDRAASLTGSRKRDVLINIRNAVSAFQHQNYRAGHRILKHAHKLMDKGRGKESFESRRKAFEARVRGKEAEVAPPGFEGTVLAMKKHKGIDNPWALAWDMKNKGAKSHRGPRGGKKESGVTKLPDGSGFFTGTVESGKEKSGWKNSSVLVAPKRLVAATQPRNQFIMKEF